MVKFSVYFNKHVFVMLCFYHSGGDAHQAFDPMIGKEGQVARASIVVNDTKVSAISYMKSELFSSKVDFRVLHPSAGFPTISVTDDISSWNVGRCLFWLSSRFVGEGE